MTDARRGSRVPWPRRPDGAVLHPGGMTAGSRGSSEATPPEPMLQDEMHPGRGARGGADMFGARSRRCLAPLQGADPITLRSRGYRCAQPPANFRHPFRILQSGLQCFRRSLHLGSQPLNALLQQCFWSVFVGSSLSILPCRFHFYSPCRLLFLDPLLVD